MSKTTREKSTYTLDEIADLLGVDPWEKIEDRNPDAWGEYYVHARREAEKENREDHENDPSVELLSDDKLDEIGIEAESEARDESYGKWKNALENAAETIFGQHGLNIAPLKTKPYLYKITPAESWEDAASKIIDTINGVGYFEFRSVKEFRDSIPTTTRQAVLGHLHWMKDRSKVYGDYDARRLMGDWDR
jgi:hypothetical protein